LQRIVGDKADLRKPQSWNREILEIGQKEFGDEHPSILTTIYNYACTLGSLGKDAEAMSLMMKCFQARSKALGIEHLNAQNALTCLNHWQNH
jgi:Tetratricopeptide repeat